MTEDQPLEQPYPGPLSGAPVSSCRRSVHPNYEEASHE